MPDLMTHTVSAFLIFPKKGKKDLLMLFVLGAAFPDLISRTFLVLAPGPDWEWPFYVCHSPVVMLFATAIFVQFFVPEKRKLYFGVLFLGECLHWFMDTFQKTLYSIDFMLYPFSWKTFSFEMIHSDHTMLSLIVLLPVLGIYVSWRHKKHRQRTAH